ncbi:Os08g0382701 [Oryza sativa Japonica Group]|uniref:Os08g0382701 protein n=1 Tax=Oryza sativa subsp. japonica TaxID=39947 RepID=A0A0P0XFF9_ORYSJ|nr:Os08g0382701 [Oryza sativa Japonica Group]
MEWTMKLARRSMGETMRARVLAKMSWKSQTKEACISPWTRARTPCWLSPSIASRICCSAKLCSSCTMSTIDKKVRPIESPAESSSRSSHRVCHTTSCCCFFRFSIWSDKGIPALPRAALHARQPLATRALHTHRHRKLLDRPQELRFPAPTSSKLALKAHLAGCHNPRRRAMTPTPQLTGAWDLASLTPPRAGREDVE